MGGKFNHLSQLSITAEAETWQRKSGSKDQCKCMLMIVKIGRKNVKCWREIINIEKVIIDSLVESWKWLGELSDQEKDLRE